MFVAASSNCFAHLPLQEALGKLVDLEFTSVELVLSESNDELRPSEIAADVNAAISRCQNTKRLTVCSYFLDIQADGPEYIKQFEAICKLAKATKVVTLTVPSSPLGTPFNEEVERCKALVDIANKQGVRVGLLGMTGRVSEDPDTVCVICDHVKGLALSLDPSHYVYQRENPPDIDKLYKYVHHVYLRDTTAEELQVRVGLGVIDYGKLVNNLVKHDFQRALCVDIAPQDDVDHMAELRKIRLLLESLLL
ncbi:MAG: sugar phosphate isomerase/epimerase family protein [Pirellulaceae bacterium]